MPSSQEIRACHLISSVPPGTTSPTSTLGAALITSPMPAASPTPGAAQEALIAAVGDCTTWTCSRSPCDMSNLFASAQLSWRKHRQEHSCLIYIVNIFSFKSAPVAFPLLSHVVSVRKWLLCSPAPCKENLHRQSPPGLGTLGSEGCTGGCTNTCGGCRQEGQLQIPTKTQTLAGRAARRDAGTGKELSRRRNQCRRRAWGHSTARTRSPLTPAPTQAPSLGMMVIVEAEPQASFNLRYYYYNFVGSSKAVAFTQI